MGKTRNTTGRLALDRLPLHNSARRGFANAQLIIALAVLAVVGILLQLQTGGISVSSRPTKKAAASAKRASKAPALIPPEQHIQELASTSDKFIAKRAQDIARIDRMQRETYEAYARMDGKRAAGILGEMDQTVAVEILAHLHERDIARILDDADPAKAAVWTVELLKRPDLSPVPDALKAAAAKAGVYDDLPDRLQQYTSSGETAVPAEGETTPAEGRAADNTQENSSADGTTGAGDTGAPPAAPADSQASPAGGPAPEQGDATAAEPGTESLA